MLLSDILLKLGEDDFTALARGVSMGKLRTYQMFESFKTRARLAKLNTETLRKAIPRLWVRLAERDEDFAKEMAQVILLSHLDLIGAVLDFLGIANNGGFFDKDLDATAYLTPGWQGRVHEQFKDAFPAPALLLYINHLGWELDKTADYYFPAPAPMAEEG
jgi:hypothetical protein